MSTQTRYEEVISKVNELLAFPSSDCVFIHDDPDSYSMISVAGSLFGAHRLALGLKLNRPVGPGERCRHSCGHKGCINPGHIHEVLKPVVVAQRTTLRVTLPFRVVSWLQSQLDGRSMSYMLEAILRERMERTEIMSYTSKRPIMMTERITEITPQIPQHEETTSQDVPVKRMSREEKRRVMSEFLEETYGPPTHDEHGELIEYAEESEEEPDNDEDLENYFD